MRVLAIGDTHLRAAARRNALRLAALDQIVAAAQQLDPDLIVWPGDLFDTKSTIDDRNTLRHYVKQFADVGPVVAVRGNHDAPGDLDIFGDLRTVCTVTVVTRPQVLHVQTSRGPIAVACLPYPEEGGLAALGIAPPDVPDVAAAALEAIFLQLAGEVTEAGRRGIPGLFIGHANVVGATASTGQPLIGAEIALRPEHLDRFGPHVPKILNHIHAAQDVHGATYVGSIAPMDWGEVEPKRFLVLEHDGRAWTMTSHRLDLPSLYHVEAVVTPTGVAWDVTRGPEGDVVAPPVSWQGHEARVRCRFNASEVDRLPEAERLLRSYLEGATVTFEPVAVPDRSVRAPEVAAAQTTAEKLAAYATHAGLEVTNGVLAKLATLENQEPAAVLGLLDERLRALVAEQAVAA